MMMMMMTMMTTTTTTLAPRFAAVSSHKKTISVKYNNIRIFGDTAAYNFRLWLTSFRL